MFTACNRKAISCVLKREEERGTAHPPVLPARPPGDLGCLTTAASRVSRSSHRLYLAFPPLSLPRFLTSTPFPLLSDENRPIDRD